MFQSITINLADAQVQAAVIQSLGAVIAAAIAAICAAIIGRQIAGRNKLRDLLQEAVTDIHFLLAVESEHCNKHQKTHEESFKVRVRQLVREQGYTWSGRFTPGRARNLLD